MAGSPRVDVQATSPGVARIDRELQGFAPRPYVHEDALHALLMKLIVISKTHNVLKQASLVNLITRI
jgi:hypothetical protein